MALGHTKKDILGHDQSPKPLLSIFVNIIAQNLNLGLLVLIFTNIKNNTKMAWDFGHDPVCRHASLQCHYSYISAADCLSYKSHYKCSHPVIPPLKVEFKGFPRLSR